MITNTNQGGLGLLHKTFLLLGLAVLPAPLLADNTPMPHPACFDRLFTEDRQIPYSINLSQCSQLHAGVPSFELEGLIQYERPRGPAGEHRGMLGYERITGAGNQVLYRLQDNQGGSGSDIALILGYEVDSAIGRMLLDSRDLQTGSGCQLGPAWAGSGTNSLDIGLHLSPVSLVTALISPEDVLPHWRDLPADELPRCDHCCVGVAEYSLSSAPHGWHLKRIQIHDLEILETHADAQLMDALLQLDSVDEDGLQLPATALSNLRAELRDATPLRYSNLSDTDLLQQLGFIVWPSDSPELAELRNQRVLQAARLWLNPDATLPALGTPLSKQEQDSLRNVLSHLGNPRLHPVDESDLDNSFATFHAELKEIVRKRDGQALISLTAPDIMLGFGGSGGHDDLRRMLAHQPSADDLWQTLLHALQPGAVQQGSDVYCLPYPSCLPSQFTNRFDAYSTLFVTQPQAALLSAPSVEADILQELDHDIVLLGVDLSDIQSEAYLPVVLRNGTQGYLARNHVHWMIDNRLEIQRSPQGWRIQSLVGGD